ncbi:inorganic anion transporter, SulP family [Leptospira ryugenii]|uniref:Inorganic anion transporter, SulP family n=1 Tax=Leptospira ryugenii TaxID=1917863 RepID=A0A2P2E0G6_9LEPT|nr:SulP family inorganic anion transporter [Leptospira ryugenii]GBF50378.1 inorganic anion transporter, SulP family [Leptospira ryugenii]
MKQNFSGTFQYLRRDASAGFITGCMAIPLSAGICIMSDYPILIGLITVVFACIVGYITSLFRPGNYVGTPGIAAGLAPALAFGVAEFGMENMPFLILLTALMQIIVWKYNLQKHILLLVPVYLVEGLLAGIGLKIALKFFPFLYTTVSSSEHWLDLARLELLGFSTVSFILFIWLFQKYSKVSPGISYFTIMAIGIASMFYLSLPKLTIEPVPFYFRFPLPHPQFFHTDAFTGVVKMIGYAMMLGAIDVIEQVMSNAAIEKIDPLKRHCHTNNSLLAIWIANLGSSFFGGMTNLDGLAKSSTNAYAGAVTKLSNLFCAAVIMVMILFPGLLSFLPQYTLGIIMVFTGGKMIYGLRSVYDHHGKYAIVLATICGLLVYKLGIFEGLLLCLLLHTIIHIYMALQKKQTIKDIYHSFRTSYMDRLEKSESNLGA